MSAPDAPGGPDLFTQDLLRRLAIPPHETRFWDDLERAMARVPPGRPDRTRERPLPGSSVPVAATNDDRALLPNGMRHRGNVVIVAIVVLAFVVVLVAARSLVAGRSEPGRPSVTGSTATTLAGPLRIVPAQARLAVDFPLVSGEMGTVGVAPLRTE